MADLVGSDLKVRQNIPSTINHDRIYRGKYPNGKDLSPHSELHGEVLGRLLRYGLAGSHTTNNQHQEWRALDDKLQAFIPLDQDEQAVQAKDPRKPVSIVFPYSYAILETLVSYLVAAFFPEPMFRYEGVAPEDVAGSTLMEKIVNLHCMRNKVALNLHTMFRDCCAYGIGIVSPQWIERRGTKVRAVNGKRLVEEHALLFEGNGLVNIDPYCYLPDPNVPIHDAQRGEFVSWLDSGNYMDLLFEEQYDDALFNVKYLEHMKGKTSSILGTMRERKSAQRRGTWDVTHDRMLADPVDLYYCYVKLIPSQWKLGSSDMPEKWQFTVAGDGLIIQARPINLYHNQFPMAICAPDFDGYSPVAYSRLKVLQGMQTTVDWLFNSHMINVRKAINDVVIVDPWVINMEDLKNPGAGGFVRLRQPAWGGKLDDAVKQLNITDITRNNIADVGFLIQYMQAVSGTDNPIMGQLRQGGPERLTAREFQGTAQGAVSRLERVAKIVGVQAMQDIGYFFAYHAQQLMSQDVYVRTVGEWPNALLNDLAGEGGRIRVTPNDILVDYDLLVRDGSIPGGNFNDAWIQLFQTIGSNEMLMQEFDTVKIFKYIAQNLGAKNVEDFARKQPMMMQPQVMPDERVAAQVEAGNMVPMGAMNGIAA